MLIITWWDVIDVRRNIKLKSENTTLLGGIGFNVEQNRICMNHNKIPKQYEEV